MTASGPFDHAAAAAPLLPTAPPAELHESHASRVVLDGDRAYKRKKPVRLPFLDQRSLARRRELCREELRLNRELAPDLYLAVRALVPTGEDGRLRLACEDDPGAVDYAVEMRRFDADATLAARLRARTLHDAQIDAVAARVAAFHAGARRVDAPAAPPSALAAALERLDRNAEQLLALLRNAAERACVVAQLRCATAFACARADRLAERAARGLVRELHGDLRAEHVLPGPPVRIVDRLEFDRALREVDVGDEVAFLAMDLTALGAPTQARRFVAAYRAAGGDPGDDALIAWHMLHRAQVRAKVALLAPAAAPLAPAAAPLAPAPAPLVPATPLPPAPLPPAAALLDLADRCAWTLRLPPVVAICGPAASGKTTLARELERRSGRQLLHADVVRKRLAGLAATDRGREEDYAPGVNRRTYAELGRLAAAAVVDGGAIVDATFRHRADRDAFCAALAQATGSPLAPLFVECVVPAAVLAARARRRLAEPDRISDATPELALQQLGAWEPLDEIAPDRHLRLRADGGAPALAGALAAAVDGALDSLPSDR